MTSHTHYLTLRMHNTTVLHIHTAQHDLCMCNGKPAVKLQGVAASSLSKYAGTVDLLPGKEPAQVRTVLDPWTGKCSFFKGQQLQDL